VISRLVAWCTHHSMIVIAVAFVVAAGGEWARRSLSRDAVPDLSDPQVGLVVDWMGHPATEVATRVTQVLTESFKSIPGSTAVRGSSMAGMAYVDVVFGSSDSLEPGRQEIFERVANLRYRLPRNIRIQIGPAASSTGWIFQYALVDPSRRSVMPIGRQLQEEVLRPALASIPGVAEVASVGETVQELVVETEPDRLRARGVAFSDVVAAVRAKAHGEPDLQRIETLPLPVPGDASARTESAGAGRSPSQKFTPPIPGSRPQEMAGLKIGDVAHAAIAPDMPTGIADFDGNQATIGGIVVARRDADPKTVIESVKRTLAELRPRLPRSVEIVTVYDRLDLANRVEHTLLRALTEEVAVVVLVILLFLLHGRSALVPMATLPLVLFMTFAGMRLLGVPATIMSLGGIGIALGMAVDAEVVALEACHRRIEGLGGNASAGERRAAIIAAAGTIAPAILTSLLITALSFLPVFAFTGETGRLLRPLAITKTLVIVSAAVVAITLGPALRERLLRGVPPEFDNPITRRLVRIYRPFVHFALARPALTLLTAAFAIVSCLPIVTRLGGEFLPRVDEGDLLFMPTTLPGVSAGDAAVQLRRVDQTLSQFPEVAAVLGKVGRANTATDPAPFSMAETTIRLRPRAEWPKLPRTRWYSRWTPAPLKRVLGLVWPEETSETTAELVEKLDQATRLPGWTSAWTAPARARMDMMSTGGVRTPVGIRVVAARPARLDAVGTALQKFAARLPGTRSAVFESLGGEPWLEFDADPAALALHKVDPALARSTADLVISGGQVGELSWENKPFRALHTKRVAPFEATHGHGGQTIPRGKEAYRFRVTPDMGMKREDADQLREVTVRSATGQPVPLGLLGHPSYVTTPAAIRTENGELVAFVYVDLNPGTDVSSYVGGAQRELDRALGAQEIRLEPGERIEWTGQYQLLAAGERRLKWIVPFVAIAMLGLLFLQFRSLTEALIVLVAVPFALVGSCWTLFLLRYPLSAPVWVGLLSAVGLAMQTGVVMVVYIDEAFHRRVREGLIRSRNDIVAAHAEGTVQRLRPKIMTITTMAAGLLPLLWADGSGAEIMKRVAAPMLGGLATSAFLTLEVLPVLYTIWRGRQLRRSQRTGVPLETIVGAVPSWARE
jgi:Cu(I)/Ag(I) efflux system membrane protein CusA/SilA